MAWQDELKHCAISTTAWKNWVFDGVVVKYCSRLLTSIQQIEILPDSASNSAAGD
jgi:hypothetical protein